VVRELRRTKFFFFHHSRFGLFPFQFIGARLFRFPSVRPLNVECSSAARSPRTHILNLTGPTRESVRPSAGTRGSSLAGAAAVASDTGRTRSDVAEEQPPWNSPSPNGWYWPWSGPCTFAAPFAYRYRRRFTLKKWVPRPSKSRGGGVSGNPYSGEPLYLRFTTRILFFVKS